MDYPSSFVGRIDTALSSENVEVFNAGVLGYSPVIYWRKIKYLIEETGFKFDEAVVFIDHSDPSDENYRYSLDEELNVRTACTQPSDKTALFFSHAFLYGLRARITESSLLGRSFYYFYDQSQLLYRSRIFRNRIHSFLKDGKTARSGTFQKSTGHAFRARGLNQCAHYLNRLNRLLKQRMIKMTVVFYPHPEQILSEGSDPFYETFWVRWCQKNQVEYIDLFSVFACGAAEAEKRSMIDSHFLKGDIHWNSEGHRLVAESYLSARSAGSEAHRSDRVGRTVQG